MSNSLIFSCIKNEGPFLLEWLSFHRDIGFNQFIIFTNDCEDGSDKMADRLQELGLIQHVRNDDYQKRGPQWTALNSPPLKRALVAADWALHLDLDEFLNIKVGGGQLSDLKDNLGNADAISIPWRFFGNSGVARFEDRPVLNQFTRCGPYPIMFPRQALMFKTLFCPSEKLDKAGVHAPRLAKGAMLEDLTWVNGDGQEIVEAFDPKRPTLHGPNFGNSLAQVNHYALKSIDSFLIKSRRGLPNHGRVPIDLGYFIRRNFNSLSDDRLARRDLHHAHFNDAILENLHHEACAWHRKTAQKIKNTESGVNLYSEVSIAGDTIPPTLQETAEIYGALGRVFGGQS